MSNQCLCVVCVIRCTQPVSSIGTGIIILLIVFTKSGMWTQGPQIYGVTLVVFLLAEMAVVAFLPRARLYHFQGALMRSKGVLPRPLPVSRRIAAASSSTWSVAQSASSDCLQFYQQQQLLQERGYASGSWGISHVELNDGVLNVLRHFNNVQVEEASGKI